MSTALYIHIVYFTFICGILQNTSTECNKLETVQQTTILETLEKEFNNPVNE